MRTFGIYLKFFILHEGADSGFCSTVNAGRNAFEVRHSVGLTSKLFVIVFRCVHHVSMRQNLTCENAIEVPYFSSEKI